MEWKKVSYGQSERSIEGVSSSSMEWELSRLTCLDSLSKKAPVLLFIESTETEKKKVRDGKGYKTETIPTSQKIKSEDFEYDVFDDSKFKIQIVSKYFNCFRMDVASIKEDASRHLCSEKAPLVAVFSSKGELIGVNERSNLNGIFSDMSEAVSPAGIDLKAVYRDCYKTMKNLYKNEVDLFELQQEEKEYRSEVAKAKGGAKKLYQKRLDKATAEVTECKTKSTALKAKFAELLRKHAQEGKSNATPAKKSSTSQKSNAYNRWNGSDMRRSNYRARR